MTGFERIKQRILQEAREEAEKIIEAAEDRSRELKGRKLEEANRLKAQFDKENEKRALEHKERLIAAAQLDMKKRVLAVKQEMIEAVFQGVMDRIREMPRDEYRKLIAATLANSSLQGDEEIIFSSYDDSKLDQGFLNEVNALFKEQGKKGQLKLAAEKGDFKAGFIAKTKGMEINSSFDAILNTVRDEMEPQVAEILFSEL